MFFSNNAISQVAWDVVVDGSVSKGNKELEGAVVTLYENSLEVDEIKTQEDGVFNFILLPGNDYLIVASKPGYVSKRASITTIGLPKEATRVAFLPWIQFDFNLFEEIKGLDVSILDMPFGKFVYDKKEDKFIYDREYTKSIQDETEKFIKAFEQKQQEKYDAFVNKADSAFIAKEYSTAKTEYQRAMEINPDEKKLKEKIAEIDRILNIAREENIAILREHYKLLIADADSAFNANDYEGARITYLKAWKINPLDKTLKTKIEKTDIMLTIDREEKMAILQEQYSKVIAKADSAFNANEYENAKDAYRQALTIKPDEIYPRNKMKEIYKILVTISAKEVESTTEELFNRSLENADMAFGAKDYQMAKNLYEEALAIKLNKKSIKGLKELDKIFKSMRAEEKTQAKTKDINKPVSEKEKYYMAIAEADKALEEQNYHFAKIKYQSALEIVPDDKYRQDKVKEIEALLAAVKSEEDRESREENTKAMADAIAMSDKDSERQTAETRFKAEEAKKDKKAIEDLLADEEKKKLFLYELAQKYPQGVTEETILEEKKKIIRRIVVKGDKANEYKKTIYTWGGIYYEKNGEDITKQAFESETGKTE